MNVRRAILDKLAQGQTTYDELMKLDYLDRLVRRTLRRMVRHRRIEEHNGVYALIGELEKVEIELPPASTPVVEEEPVEAGPVTLSGLTQAAEEVKEDYAELLELLDNSVKEIAKVLPTLSTEELGLLRTAEEAGKTRKSLIAVFDKLTK